MLLSVHQLKKAFGARPLFENITFSIETGERIGLIGPNGAGKSTLLKILAGRVSADEGKVSVQRGVRFGFLEQIPLFQPGATVQSTVLEGAPAADAHDWEVTLKVDEILSKLSLNELGADTLVDTLSGGWKKRVALARELMREPDLLFLDEPTNHLDVEGIEWLETFLAGAGLAAVTITHDRVFLQAVSNRILELDRRNPEGILSHHGDYADFLDIKEQKLAAQQRQEVRLKNTLRREVEWLRRGAKARTTKQQARIQRAGELKSTVEEVAYRNQSQVARLDFGASDRSPKKLIEAKGISKSYSGKTVVPKLDLLVTPGSRIGLLGTNGCGKSTLIRILLGEERPDTGEVFRSDLLQVAYFEQNRESLDPNLSVLKTLCPTGDTVDYRGNRVHNKSYLDRFLFSHAQMEMAVGKLSGGEQSRLLIARLMLRQANLLVLDEPTNDLDMATLDVLEEVLKDFNGAVLLVSHDRYFLDQVSTQILAFGTDERGAKEIVSFTGLDQWEVWHRDQRAPQKESKPQAAAPSSEKKSDGTAASPSKRKKLSYKEQRELDEMEPAIHKAEARLQELELQSEDPKNATQSILLGQISKEMAELHAEIDRLYSRWAELSGE
ncbi:MAG: ABC-F family ATP-binding cassette domain-containing protein [Bdellovibrio sp.]|nr:ABC-F family ATP-binding cassette domain-containing protein [Bdellovibrio sp.]